MKKYLNKLAVGGSSVLTGLQLAAGNALALDPGEEITAQKGFAKNIGSLINGVLTFVMVIGALLVFLYLILGGIEWITSGGDKSKTEKARNKITAAVVGLVILAASYAILILILNFLGFDNLGQVFTAAEGLE